MTRTITSLGVFIASAMLVVQAYAQDEKPSDPEKPAATSTGKQPDKEVKEQPDRSPLTGLDAALGLKEESEVPPEELPIDPSQSELERKLSGAEMADAFVKATRLMDDTATRIEMVGDTGIITQRLQEDILRALDQIIEAAKQQQQSSSSSGSSSSSSNSQSPPQQQSSRASEGENTGQVSSPSRQEGGLNATGAGMGATWGALPARVRDALSQGQAGRFSSVYRALTEAYYRRLAEEAGK